MRAVFDWRGKPHAVEKLCTLSTVIHNNSQKEKEAKRKRNGRRRLSSSLRTTTTTTTLNQVNCGPNNREPLRCPSAAAPEEVGEELARVGPAACAIVSGVPSATISPPSGPRSIAQSADLMTMLDEEHGVAGLAEPEQHAEEFADVVEVQPGSGLVVAAAIVSLISEGPGDWSRREPASTP